MMQMNKKNYYSLGSQSLHTVDNNNNYNSTYIYAEVHTLINGLGGDHAYRWLVSQVGCLCSFSIAHATCKQHLPYTLQLLSITKTIIGYQVTDKISWYIVVLGTP